MSAPRLAGRVALVTGGAGAGIGGAVSRRLAAEGACVVVADSHAGRTSATADALRSAGHAALGIPLDVADPAAVDAAVARAASEFGRPVDVLVNSAAVNVVGPIADTTPDDWRRVLDVDLVAPWYLCRAVLPGMAAAGGGAIVNVCSLVAYLGEAQQMAYASAKAGLGTLTRSVALEGGPLGVRCNAVSPGIIASRFVDKYRDQLEPEIARTPLRRAGDPDEVAKVIAFLVSDDASFVTGETIAVSGGLYSRP